MSFIKLKREICGIVRLKKKFFVPNQNFFKNFSLRLMSYFKPFKKKKIPAATSDYFSYKHVILKLLLKYLSFIKFH